MSGNIPHPKSIKRALRLLKTRVEGTMEWMLHLGYPADLNSRENQKIFGRFFLDRGRYEELKLLLSQDVGEEILDNKNNLISYREL